MAKMKEDPFSLLSIKDFYIEGWPTSKPIIESAVVPPVQKQPAN